MRGLGLPNDSWSLVWLFPCVLPGPGSGPFNGFPANKKKSDACGELASLRQPCTRSGPALARDLRYSRSSKGLSPMLMNAAPLSSFVLSACGSATATDDEHTKSPLRVASGVVALPLVALCPAPTRMRERPTVVCP